MQTIFFLISLEDVKSEVLLAAYTHATLCNKHTHFHTLHAAIRYYLQLSGMPSSGLRAVHVMDSGAILPCVRCWSY